VKGSRTRRGRAAHAPHYAGAPRPREPEPRRGPAAQGRGETPGRGGRAGDAGPSATAASRGCGELAGGTTRCTGRAGAPRAPRPSLATRRGNAEPGREPRRAAAGRPREQAAGAGEREGEGASGPGGGERTVGRGAELGAPRPRAMAGEAGTPRQATEAGPRRAEGASAAAGTGAAVPCLVDTMAAPRPHASPGRGEAVTPGQGRRREGRGKRRERGLTAGEGAGGRRFFSGRRRAGRGRRVERGERERGFGKGAADGWAHQRGSGSNRPRVGRGMRGGPVGPRGQLGYAGWAARGP
jgi:hypothetical protein